MSGLRQSIDEIPERYSSICLTHHIQLAAAHHDHHFLLCRNEARKPGLIKRWEALVNAASIRPAPDPIRYTIARSLLCDITKQIPRLSHGFKQQLGTVEPLATNPTKLREAEEDRKRKEAEKMATQFGAARYATVTPPVLTSEQQQKAKEDGIRLKELQTKEEADWQIKAAERAEKDDQWRTSLVATVSSLISQQMTEFHSLAA